MTKEVHQNCRICSQLKDVKTGSSKYGWPDQDEERYDYSVNGSQTKVTTR